MKNILVILIACFVFNACKKDSSGSTTLAANSKLAGGKWNILRDTMYFYNKGSVKMQVDSSYHGDAWWIFNQDGTGNDQNTRFTYNFSAGNLTIKTAAYVLNGDTYDADTYTVKVIRLTNNSLGMLYDWSTTTNGVKSGNVLKEYSGR